MIDSDYRAWDECPGVDNCQLIHSFLELVDSMVRDIQHLKAETIRARYELSQKYDPEHKWITTVDILSNLDDFRICSLIWKSQGQKVTIERSWLNTLTHWFSFLMNGFF